MDRSRLRDLAQLHARGEIEEEDYLRQRADLIDGIVAGEVPIERAADMQPAAAATDDREAPPPRPASRLPYSAVHLMVGVVVVVAVVWVLVPASPPPADPVAPAPPVRAPEVPAKPAISPARDVVDRFLEGSDWSAGRLERFLADWEGLPGPDREEALSSPWFRRLISALRQEINAQRALVSLDPSGDAAETGVRLAAFGARLGIARDLPRFEPPPPAAPARREARAATGSEVAKPATVKSPAVKPAAAKPPAAKPVAAKPPAAKPGPTKPAAAASPAAGDGNRWLGEQDQDHYTLQLFAVSKLEKVRALVRAHPDLRLRVLDYADRAPRYRIVYGRWATADAARAAHRALPVDLTRASTGPLVRRIGDLRPGPAAASAGTPAAGAGSWLGAQPAGSFTLQVFASDQPEGARRLVDRFPELGLEIVRSRDPRSRYRVLHGVFPTADGARAAAGALPPRLLAAAGKPLVRAISELKALAAGP